MTRRKEVLCIENVRRHCHPYSDASLKLHALSVPYFKANCEIKCDVALKEC